MEDATFNEEFKKCRFRYNALKEQVEQAKKETPSDSDIQRMKDTTDRLMKALNEMATKLYQQQGPQGQPGPDFNGGQGFGGGPKGGDDDVTPRLELAINLHDNAVAHVVKHERLLGLSQAELPRSARMLERVEGARAGSAVVARNKNHIGQRL